MRTVHFDCFSGISGDMVLGAVIDAGVPSQAIVEAIRSLELPIELEIEKVKRCGIAATKVNVLAKDEEDYRFLPDIEAILARATLTPRQRELALTIFRKLAVAEAAVHGMPVEKVHFHEVGALDSIADIVGSAVGLDLLNADRFTSRSVPTGNGSVKCAHGVMPIPAPATVNLLKGVPLAASPVKGELTTPTGAAILATIVQEYMETPTITVSTIGYGAGTKDFLEHPNLLRLLVGETATSAGPGSVSSSCSDTVCVLETNLDDTPGEMIGYCMERLFAAGALDVFTVPIQMKKLRPGVLLSVIVEPAHIAKAEAILFRETGTFGIRRSTLSRSKLHRESVRVQTPWGEVRAKRGTHTGGFAIITPEYDDCARLAVEQNIPLREVYAAVTQRS